VPGGRGSRRGPGPARLLASLCLAAAALLGSGSFAGCSGGGASSGQSSGAGSSSGPVAGSGRGDIGAAGGVVSLSGGPAAGAEVTVPAGALAATQALTIDAGTDVASSGAVLAGPAVRFGPSGLAFAAPVVVTVPFEAARIPTGSAVSDLLVLHRDDGAGAVTDLVAASIDAAGGRISVAASAFSTFQAAVRPAPVPPTPTATPLISVTPTAVDFGAVTLGSSADRSLVVTNVGGGTLTGTATAATPLSFVGSASYSLAAGASASITARFTPGGAGTFSASIALSGGGGASVVATGRGDVVVGGGAGVLSPRVGAFGAVGVGASADLVLTVSCTSATPLVGAAQAGPPFAIVGAATYALSQGQSQGVTIRFTPAQVGPATGTATFSDVTPSAVALSGFGGAPLSLGPTVAVGAPADLALPRLDGDATLDAFVGRRGSTALLLNGDGSLGFTFASAPLTGLDQDRVVAADLDGDGFEDLASADAARGIVTILWGDAASALTATTTIDLAAAGAGPGGADALAVADLHNLDALRDLLVARTSADRVSVLRHTAGRTFTALAGVAVTSPADIVAADLDSDAIVDAAVATGAAGGVALLKGDNGGGLTLMGGAAGLASASRIALADLDHEGRLDLAVLDPLNEVVATWRNLGGGMLLRLSDGPTGQSPTDFVAADLDGDGEADMAVALAGGGGPALLRNQGGASGFTLSVPTAVTGAQRAIAAGDLDGDGALDLVVARETSPGLGDLVSLRGLAPPFSREIDALGTRLTSPSGSVIFVLDLSLTMDFGTSTSYVDYLGRPAVGRRLARAKSAIAGAILSMPSWFRFDVYGFDCAVQRWQPAPVMADAAARADAISWLYALQAIGQNGTGQAVAQALADDPTNRTIVLVGDGGVGCGPNLPADHLRLILVANTQDAEVHTLGIDIFGQQEQLYRNIATQTQGVFIRVP